MWCIMKEVEELSGKELSIGELDDKIEKYYETLMKPIGFANGRYRAYKYNDYVLLAECHLIKKSEIIRDNVVKIGEMKAIK